MIDDNNLRQFKEPNSLPIDEQKRTLLYLLEKHRVVVVVGETGSGKSTRIPQILFSAGIYNESSQPSKKSIICITQPRRVVAIQLAQRVAKNLNCDLGTTVGYAIRFQDVTSEHTMIKYVTEGLLLREMMSDPMLSSYSVVMIDEVHERSLNTDILLGLLKCVLNRRSSLKLIVCSATLNIEQLCKFFTFEQDIPNLKSSPGILSISTKLHPVKIHFHQEAVANYMDAAYNTAVDIHESNRLASGKILIFMTGQDEVEYVCDKLKEYAKIISSRMDLRKLIVLPLHASLSPNDISLAFEEHGHNTRVCIVSTNVAETSLTIDDVAFVIDSGFTKLKVFNHQTGIDSLIRAPISKSSAIQRAGRAGRTRAGIVYRLFSEKEYNKLDQNTVAEIQRSSLTETVMLLKSLGVGNLQKFPLISPMPRDNLLVALELLYALRAIDEQGNLSETGEKMARFNLDPKLAKMLLSDETTPCTLEACRVAAILQIKDIFVKPGRYASGLWSNSSLTSICSAEGDMLSYLNIMSGFINSNKSEKWATRRHLNYQAMLSATQISERLETQLRRCGRRIISCKGRLEVIQKSIVSGLFSNAAYLDASGDYKTIKGNQTVYIHPTSVFSEIIELPKYVVFVEILNTTKPFMRHIMSIEPNWLLDIAPHFYTFATSLEMMRKYN